MKKKRQNPEDSTALIYPIMIGLFCRFGDNVDFDFHLEVAVQVHLSGVLAQLLDSVLVDGDFVTVDLNVMLSFEGVGHHDIVHRTEECAGFRSLCRDIDFEAFDLTSQEFGFLADLFSLESALFDGFRQHFLLCRGSEFGITLRNEVIAGITVLNLYEIIGITQISYVLFQYDFHDKMLF